MRPSKLELYVADADGRDARQVTYLDAASFGPAFAPGGQRIIFSSNYGDPRGREFDLWAIDVDGTRLERITAAPGFDGFPLFSPDGKRLAFASNRATAPGAHDTNVFVADWKPEPMAPAAVTAGASERARRPDRRRHPLAGRSGAAGARHRQRRAWRPSGAYIEQRFKALGLEPARRRRRLPAAVPGAHRREGRAGDGA